MSSYRAHSRVVVAVLAVYSINTTLVKRVGFIGYCTRCQAARYFAFCAHICPSFSANCCTYVMCVTHDQFSPFSPSPPGSSALILQMAATLAQIVSLSSLVASGIHISLEPRGQCKQVVWD